MQALTFWKTATMDRAGLLDRIVDRPTAAGEIGRVEVLLAADYRLEAYPELRARVPQAILDRLP